VQFSRQPPKAACGKYLRPLCNQPYVKKMPESSKPFDRILNQKKPIMIVIKTTKRVHNAKQRVGNFALTTTGPSCLKVTHSSFPGTSMKLLPKELLVKTGPVDHADWNYSPILGPISRTRFRAVRAMLVGKKFPRLLEMGYGSGVFLPELRSHTEELFGVDLHKFAPTVSAHLKKANMSAQLFSSDARFLPFPNQYFQCVVAVSVLEFVEDLDAVSREILRVLTPDGVLLVVTPGSSPILDAGLKLLTGESAKRDFGNRRKNLIPTLLRHFAVREERNVGLPFLPLYTALSLGPRPALAAVA